MTYPAPRIDAPAVDTTTDVTAYAGTRIQGIVDRNGGDRTFVTRITPELDAIDQPLIVRKSPGLSFEITPRDYKLSDIADAYIHLK